MKKKKLIDIFGEMLDSHRLSKVGDILVLTPKIPTFLPCFCEMLGRTVSGSSVTYQRLLAESQEDWKWRRECHSSYHTVRGAQIIEESAERLSLLLVSSSFKDSSARSTGDEVKASYPVCSMCGRQKLPT